MARAGVDELAALRFPAWSGTLAINVAGSFILGIASVTLPAEWVMVIGTGFCGGFTTFSTACWQTAREFGRRNHSLAAAYLVATVVGCLSAAYLGVLLGSVAGVVRPG